MMEVKCMAWGPEYSKYFKNRSYYFIIISQKSAGCPCPLPFPDLVKLGPNPDSMFCENPGLFLPFWQIPTCHFSGRPETSHLSGWDVLPGTKPDPFRGSMINPLEECLISKLSQTCPCAVSTPAGGGSWQSGRSPAWPWGTALSSWRPLYHPWMLMPIFVPKPMPHSASFPVPSL